MKQRTTAELGDCNAVISALEAYKAKLEAEAKRQASEASSLGRLVKLAKGQRNRMSSGHLL